MVVCIVESLIFTCTKIGIPLLQKEVSPFAWDFGGRITKPFIYIYFHMKFI